MDLAEYSEIYDSAIEKWGHAAQFEQAVEECAELIAAIKHYQRGKVSEQVVIEELADVLLMAGQMVHMLGEGAVREATQAKVDKLEKLLESPAEK